MSLAKTCILKTWNEYMKTALTLYPLDSLILHHFIESNHETLIKTFKWLGKCDRDHNLNPNPHYCSLLMKNSSNYRLIVKKLSSQQAFHLFKPKLALPGPKTEARVTEHSLTSPLNLLGQYRQQEPEIDECDYRCLSNLHNRKAFHDRAHHHSQQLSRECPRRFSESSAHR